MKIFNQLLIVLVTITMFTSCASMFYPNEKKYENVYTGMTIAEFKKAHPKAINVYMNYFTTCYSITYFDTEKKFVNTLEEATYKKFYYFEKNILVKVDKGEREVDYRIQVD